MADGREDDREATFQFIEEVQNCPDLWDVSSAAYKDTKTFEGRKIFCAKLLDERVVRSKGGISADIRFRPNLSISPALSVSSQAINIK